MTSSSKSLKTPDLGVETLFELAAHNPELLVAAIESCPVNITIADANKPDMPLIYANPSFRETTGYPSDDIIGKNCRFLQGPDTDQDAVAELRSAISTQRKTNVEFINYKKDGEPFINALTVAPVHDVSGALISFIGIQNDVTQQRKLEQKKIEEQRLQALGQMAGGVAHQLNNLLHPVISLTSLHKSDLNDPQVSGDFEIVLESARQAANVVHDVLAFSKQGVGETIDVCVSELVKENVDFIRSMLPVTMKLSVTINEGAESATARLDKIRFCQVMANIMINSSQATNGLGRIDVFVSPIEKQLVSISIIDNGPGISTDIQSQIFEPFFTTKQKNGGTGLGLSVVYGIVKSFNGKITSNNIIDGEKIDGCKMNIILPRSN